MGRRIKSYHSLTSRSAKIKLERSRRRWPCWASSRPPSSSRRRHSRKMRGNLKPRASASPKRGVKGVKGAKNGTQLTWIITPTKRTCHRPESATIQKLTRSYSQGDHSRATVQQHTDLSSSDATAKAPISRGLLLVKQWERGSNKFTRRNKMRDWRNSDKRRASVKICHGKEARQETSRRTASPNLIST